MSSKSRPNNFLLVFIRQRQAIRTLVARDFKARYLSSYIGLPWAFIQPAVYVLVIWFAFSVGLRVGHVHAGIPFVPWLLSAMIPWMFISHTLIVTCSSIQEYSYLIRKTTLNVWVIPLIKIFSGILIHLILMTFVILLMIIIYGITPEIHWLQFFYYLFAMVMLMTGIAWFVSSVNVLVHDMAHMVNVLTTVMFWATPIIWPVSRLSGSLRYIALLNPFFYITEGYRYTFVEKTWFFENPEMNIFFWSMTTVIFIAGALTFRKLKPVFGDVL